MLRYLTNVRYLIHRLDDAIEACRTTAEDMHVHYKETSLAGLAVSCECRECREGEVKRRLTVDYGENPTVYVECLAELMIASPAC